jgi:hypothetical protein
MQRLHVGDRRDAGALAPAQKFPRRLGIGVPRVFVADPRGEEFEEVDLRGRPDLSNDREGTIIDGNDWRSFSQFLSKLSERRAASIPRYVASRSRIGSADFLTSMNREVSDTQARRYIFSGFQSARPRLPIWQFRMQNDSAEPFCDASAVNLETDFVDRDRECA